MITGYLEAALKRAHYTPIKGSGYCAEVRGLAGVIATGATLEDCRATLKEVIEEWILVRVSRNLDIPALGKAKIRVRKAG